jgi:hypothetical protein
VLKTVGYLVSTVSVLLLAIPSLKSASEQPILFVALVGGVATSICGMLLRWLSYRREQKEKQAAEAGQASKAGYGEVRPRSPLSAAVRQGTSSPEGHY